MKTSAIPVLAVLLSGALVAASVSSADAALPVVGETQLLSSNANGDFGNNDSGFAQISDDGRYVVFSSKSNNLVPGDINGHDDVFERDLLLNTLALVSQQAFTDPLAYGNSDNASVSADGRYVAFSSDASNLVPAGTDTNSEGDVFERDMTTGITTLVSKATDGTQGTDYSFETSVSGDGRYVAYSSRASNLVASDTNGGLSIFVTDTVTHVTTLVDTSTAGEQGDAPDYAPRISLDGKFVTFQGNSHNLTSVHGAGYDIYLRNLAANETTLIDGGLGGTGGDGASGSPTISGDGRYVAFSSGSTNLVSGDTNGTTDVFLHDNVNNTTIRVSNSSAGVQGDGVSWEPAISSNGRYVAFSSLASNFSAASGVNLDVYVHDLQSGSTGLASAATDGTLGDNGAELPSLSGDASILAFDSQSSNTVPGGTVGRPQVYAHGVLHAPDFTVQPNAASVQAGQSAAFHAAATQNPTWQWQSNSGAGWTDVAGAVSADLTVASASASLNGTSYRVVATNGGGSTTSATAQLTVTPAPVVKAAAKITATAKKIKVGKKAAIVVTVKSTVSVSGTVSVKIGSKTVASKVKLKKGKATVTIAAKYLKTAKIYSAKVTYSGSATIASVTKTVKIVVKKK